MEQSFTAHVPLLQHSNYY